METEKPKADVAGKRRPEPEDLPVVIEIIAEEAISLRKACAKLGLHPGHVHAAIAADNDLWAQYARAREQRADYLAEQVVTIGLSAIAPNTKTKPDAARVAIDALKWAAGRMAPKAYGDRLALEHTGKDGEALPVAPAPVTFVAVYPGRRDPE